MSVHLNPDQTLGFHRTCLADQEAPSACLSSCGRRARTSPTKHESPGSRPSSTHELTHAAGPLTQLVKRTLTVTNSNSHAVAFKVKTTAPKQYCVRPNSGRIEAGERVEVQVLLQPMKEDPPASFRCRDKFLVQSVPITAERESLALADLWSVVEKEDKANVHESKIRCIYLPPVDSNGGDHGVAAVAAGSHSPQTSLSNGYDHGVSRTRTHPLTVQDSSFATVRNAPSEFVQASSPQMNGGGITARESSLDAPTAGPAPPVAEKDAEAAPAPPTSLPSVSTAAAAAGAAVVGLGAATAAAVGVPESKIKAVTQDSAATSVDNNAALQAKLKAAEAEVARLQAQLGSDGLRKRNVGTTGTTARAPAAVQSDVVPPQGAAVPLQVVAGLMLASFVLGMCVPLPLDRSRTQHPLLI